LQKKNKEDILSTAQPHSVYLCVIY